MPVTLMAMNSNGNMNFNRNGSMNNIHNVEKTMLKFQHLQKMLKAMEIQYWLKIILQHADHYLRRYNELNERKDNTLEKTKTEEKSIVKENISDKEEISKTTN